MARGGKREGAGRKNGAMNLLSKSLKDQINGERMIDFLSDMANGKVEGASLEQRKDAATTLLKKVLPDMRRQKTEIQVEEFVPFKIYYSSEGEKAK